MPFFTLEFTVRCRQPTTTRRAVLLTYSGTSSKKSNSFCDCDRLSRLRLPSLHSRGERIDTRSPTYRRRLYFTIGLICNAQEDEKPETWVDRRKTFRRFSSCLEFLIPIRSSFLILK